MPRPVWMGGGWACLKLEARERLIGEGDTESVSEGPCLGGGGAGPGFLGGGTGLMVGLDERSKKEAVRGESSLGVIGWLTCGEGSS